MVVEKPKSSRFNQICTTLGLNYKLEGDCVRFTPSIQLEKTEKLLRILFECGDLGFSVYVADVLKALAEDQLAWQLRIMKENYIDKYLEEN